MCEVFDQISDVRGLDGSVFIYGDYSTCHIVLQRMVTYKMEGPAKTVMLEKLGLVTWIKFSIFIKLFGKKRPHQFLGKIKSKNLMRPFFPKGFLKMENLIHVTKKKVLGKNSQRLFSIKMLIHQSFSMCTFLCYPYTTESTCS